MREILTVYVNVDNTTMVTGSLQKVVMVGFSGRAESEFFKGEILSGAVDTQFYPVNGVPTLSARYALKGVDFEGKDCLIFIENNCVSGSEYTMPRITTDSTALSFLESCELCGRIESSDGLIIRIFDRRSF